VSWSDIAIDLGPLAAVPLLLVGLTLWMRRNALRAAASDPDAAWFRYASFLRLSTQAGWLVWLALLSLPGVERFVKFVAGPPRQVGAVGTYAIYWAVIALVPMAVTLIICRTLSYPVFAQVHNSQWTRGEIFAQAFWTQAAYTVPALCFAEVFGRVAHDEWRPVVLLGMFGFAWIIFSRRMIVRSSRRSVEWLSTGELRDHIGALAAKAGVKLRTVYVLSTGKSRMANAFAARGNMVILTDYLLTHLTRREVDAVVAHELTHLHKRHAVVRVVMLMAVVYLVIGITMQWMRFGTVPLVLAFALLIFFFTARVNERTADAGAAKITGDPEAMITALAKITRLNKFPLRWSKWNDWLMTHPSTSRRTETIARQAGITQERLAEILRAGTTGDTYYSLPAALSGEGKVFSTQYKSGALARNSWTLVAILTLGPAAILGLANTLHWGAAGVFGAWVAGVLLPFALYVAAINYLSVAGNAKLETRLRDRLRRTNAAGGGAGGICVSFSPNAVPRLYGGNYAWDIGILYFGPEAIAYVGEEIQFGLKRDGIIEVKVLQGMPSWVRTRAVQIRWHDTKANRYGAFLLRLIAVRSVEEQSRLAEALAAEISCWREGTRATTETPVGQELAAPVQGEVSSTPPDAMVGGQRVMRSLILLGYFSAAAGVIFNLSFLGSSTGWLAVVATEVLALLQFVPFWRYRDPSRARAVAGAAPVVN
jgi:Zn-dependent protease with chaperone function